MADSGQKLPQREAGIFKKIVRCYECKQYKNGLKFCRQILSSPKLSEHGETLAMKGLILNCMGRKEEAYDHVRRGLKNDIKSHVCWHVYGLLQRSDKKYEEAIKCYRNALKWDHENVQILRDLSLLQIQMRDIEGFRDTRYQLLKARPAQRSSWVGYALSYHLIKDYTMALKVMEEYRKTQVAGQNKPDYEFNEMILYEGQLLSESGKPDEALKHLQTFEQHICDLLTYWETKAEILCSLGRRSEAEVLYHELIHRNPENYHYFHKLEKCLLLEEEDQRLKLYLSLQEVYRRSHSVRRIPLKFSSGDMFLNLIDKYLRRGLHKGMHSLFMSIRNLYSDPVKVQVIGELVSGYVNSLRLCAHFFPKDTGPAEPPTAYLWSLYLSAQHYNRTGDCLKALQHINDAIDHTPTEVQLYMLKAKILKHAGDIQQAAFYMNEARTLDTADRFVNCKSAKYYLRSSAVDVAIETAALFTREGLPPLQTMDEMQCMWFQTEMARAYHRLGKLGDALQKLHEIDQHFVDIIDDQFDFHTYCMRKMTLRAYVGVLKLEDRLRSHPFYMACAKLAIEIYVYLYDNPSAKLAKLNGPAVPEEQLSASELKKLQRKQKKAQLKAQAAKAAEEKTKEHKTHGRGGGAGGGGGGGGEEDKKTEEKEPKFDAVKLLQTDKPLEDAVKFLIPLQALSPGNPTTHTLAYEIHSRRRKFLLMLQALKRLHDIDSEHGELHRMLVDFILTVEASRESLPGPVLEVISGTLPRLTGGLDLTQLNQQFLDKHQHSLPHLVPGGRVLYRLHPDARDRALGCVCSLSDKLRGRTLKRCAEVLSLLKSGEFGDSDDRIKSYSRSCHALFPLATTFKPAEPPDKGGQESRNDEPLASNSVDEVLASATVQRLGIE